MKRNMKNSFYLPYIFLNFVRNRILYQNLDLYPSVFCQKQTNTISLFSPISLKHKLVLKTRRLTK